jgi:uncharacterized protein (TIGR03083 family)
VIALVEQLDETWRSLEALCAGFSEAEWKAPTGCPGWTVQDNVSHLIDYESFALGRPRADHDVEGAPAHVKNDMGAMNEVGVDARRGRSGANVLDEFREVMAARRQRLGELTDDDLERETQTPIGPGTVRDLLTLRVMDTWSHEQDIRRALDRPGHADGPVVDTVVEYLSRFLGFAVAKRAGAPDGTTAVFAVGDHPPVAVEVAGGRGRALDAPPAPTVRLELDPVTFAALACGRSDAPADLVTVRGDEALGRRIVASLGFMP